MIASRKTTIRVDRLIGKGSSSEWVLCARFGAAARG